MRRNFDGSLFGPKQGNKLISRLLPERSYLYYKYPQKNNDYSVEFYLPILENIEISESQRPNLGTYDLLGRAGNLYSYHGARSREFNIRFYMTLPHIVEYIVNYGMNEQFTDSFRFFSNDREYEKRMFFQKELKKNFNTLKGATDIERGEVNKDLYFNLSRSRYSDLLPPKSELQQLIEQFNVLGNQLFKLPVLENLSDVLNIFRIEEPKVLKNSISYLMLMINVIRTSTLNNSKNTSLGPPSIYINHGTMYNNIPCVCTNYSIRLISEAGYDLTTMAPRRIEINMNLSENRTGNFGAFVPFEYITGENLAGWEAVIEERTLDPWNSTFGSYDADLKNLASWEKAIAEEAISREAARQQETRQLQRQDILNQRADAENESRVQIRQQVVNDLNSSTNPLEFGDSKEAVIELPLTQDYDTFNASLPVGLDPTATTIQK